MSASRNRIITVGVSSEAMALLRELRQVLPADEYGRRPSLGGVVYKALVELKAKLEAEGGRDNPPD